MNKQSVTLPGSGQKWGSYISKYQPDSSDVLDNMFTSGSKNFVTDQTGMIDKRQGGVKWNRTNFGNVAQDTYEAVFESGARHFLRVGGGILSASTGSGLFDVITSGYSTIGNFEWATYQDRSYGDNGINPPQVYDIATSYGGVSYSFTTAKTKVMGAQAPVSAPTSGAYTSGGAVPTGSHTYKITFMYYDSEESNGSPASAVQTATSGVQTGNLSAIPIGGYGVTARNIYRDNNDGVYLLLDTIPNNTATTYTDVLAEGSTPTPIPLFNDVPPTFSKIALWLDSLFIAPVGETNTIRYSNAGFPDIFDPDNFITCQSDDVVTALYVYNGKLYVFGLHSFGSIEGNTPDTFFYRNINNFVGCVDNRSIQVRSIVSVPTLWWLSSKGFYYSNGYTVEYGSDFIQDLVNLNIAQVNYSTNKNTQTSFEDFEGDTSSPGIDLLSNPGAINLINPKQVYSDTTDWLDGLSLINIKTSDSPFLEVPTNFTPTLGSGSLGGSAFLSAVNIVTLPGQSSDPGEHHNSTGRQDWLNDAVNTRYFAHTLAQSFIPGATGTLDVWDAVNFRAYWSSHSGSWTMTVEIAADSGGIPGSVLASQTYTFPTLFDTQQTVPPTTFTVGLTGGTKYWFVMGINSISGDGQFSSIDTSSGWSSGQTMIGANLPGIWSSLTPPESPTPQMMMGGYTYVTTPVPETGSWTSPIYDSGGTTAVAGFALESGTYASPSSGTMVVYGSPNPDMSGATSQTISNPNGSYALSLAGFRYWQIVLNLSAPNPLISEPQMGQPQITFNTTGTWISNPIDATTDNTGWQTLTFTGNVPGGTSATLNIATSADNITYSSFGPIGSAVTEPWAKVQVVLTTDGSNTTSPSISSVTLTWSLTSQIESTPIDTGTTPAGFSVVQWELSNTNGSTTFYLRTATTSIGLASATYVAVLNGAFPALSALQFVQWKLILTGTADNTPEITSVTVNWFIASGPVGVRAASIFFNKTYYVSVATTGSTANNTLIQLDQFGNWRIQKDASIGCFLSYFNTLYFTDGITDSIFNGFIANTDNGTPIMMDVRTKAWNASNDLFLKVPRAFKITGINTGTTIHAYYSPDRGTTWYEMLNEQGVTGFVTDISLTEFVILFVPDATTLVSGRTLMFRIVSSDIFPCSILNYTPSFYSRKGRYLSNG